jgi:hypothetical protein
MDKSLEQTEFSIYLRPQHQVRVGFHLSDDNIIDINAIVISIEESILHLETFGSNTAQIAQVKAGVTVVILSSENWAFCRCQGILDAAVGRNFTIRLRGKPEIQQRRENFRMDVNIPIIHSEPEDQQLTSVEGIWKARRMMCDFADPPKIVTTQGSFKVIDWNDGPPIEPCRINLSGGGIRVKTFEPYPPGFLLNVTLFIALSQIKIIDAVTSVIRSTEIRLTLDNRPAYTTAMKFEFLTERDRESIITFIFNEQRNALSMQF